MLSFGFICFVIFLFRTRHFEYCNMKTLEIIFYSLPRDYCCYLIKAEVICLCSDFPKVFLQRVCSLFYVVTDVFSVILMVSQWFDRNFLKCLNLIREEKRGKECSVSLNPLVWLCWGSHLRHGGWNNGQPLWQLLSNQKQWSTLITLIFGGQGPHCPLWHQQLATGSLATAPIAACHGTGSWGQIDGMPNAEIH